MIAGYASDELKKLCTQRRVAMRDLGEKAAKGLGRRIKELETCGGLADLMIGTGKWHPVFHDYPGCYSGKVDGGCRIVVKPNESGGFVIIAVGIKAYKH